MSSENKREQSENNDLKGVALNIFVSVASQAIMEILREAKKNFYDKDSFDNLLENVGDILDNHKEDVFDLIL